MRVLLVEDEIKMARAIAARARAGGLRGRRRRSTATTACTGHRWDYDAIVLDVMLPGLDGIEVCRRLRARRAAGRRC